MTYKKPLKDFQGTTLMGQVLMAEDTLEGERLGSYAIEAFEAHKTIKGKKEAMDNGELLVPFHAVKSAMYATLTEDAVRTDPYCGGGTEPSVGEVWYTGVGGLCNNGGTNARGMTATDKADVDSLLSTPNAFDVSVNGTPMTLVAAVADQFMYTDTGSAETFEESIQGVQNEGQWDVGAFVKCSANNTPVEIIITKK